MAVTLFYPLCQSTLYYFRLSRGWNSNPSKGTLTSRKCMTPHIICGPVAMLNHCHHCDCVGSRVQMLLWQLHNCLSHILWHSYYFQISPKWHNDIEKLVPSYTTNSLFKLNCDTPDIMRLYLLHLCSLVLFFHHVSSQRSWWNRGQQGRRQRPGRERPRRYNSDNARTNRRRYQRPYEQDSTEGDNLRISSSELSKRVSSFERRQPSYNQYRYSDTTDYYPSYQRSNVSLIESTPEYKIETRNGDTIIEFARSGETQGKNL